MLKSIFLTISTLMYTISVTYNEQNNFRNVSKNTTEIFLFAYIENYL